MKTGINETDHWSNEVMLPLVVVLLTLILVLRSRYLQTTGPYTCLIGLTPLVDQVISPAMRSILRDGLRNNCFNSRLLMGEVSLISLLPGMSSLGHFFLKEYYDEYRAHSPWSDNSKDLVTLSSNDQTITGSFVAVYRLRDEKLLMVSKIKCVPPSEASPLRSDFYDLTALLMTRLAVDRSYGLIKSKGEQKEHENE